MRTHAAAAALFDDLHIGDVVQRNGFGLLAHGLAPAILHTFVLVHLIVHGVVTASSVRPRGKMSDARQNDPGALKLAAELEEVSRRVVGE